MWNKELPNNEEKEGMAIKFSFCFWLTCERLVENFLFTSNVDVFYGAVNIIKHTEAWSQYVFAMGKHTQLHVELPQFL